MENTLIKKLIQIGIRTMTDHQQKQVEKYDISVITMNDFSSDMILQFEDPYISIDLDGIDPAYAPEFHIQNQGDYQQEILSK